MVEVSKLPKLWIFDLDGTLVKHNGYLIDGHDTLLGGVKEFFESLPKSDKVLIITARKRKYKRKTLAFLRKNGVFFTKILFEMPIGERILVNDQKPKGLKTSVAINTKRDVFMTEKFLETDI